MSPQILPEWFPNVVVVTLVAYPGFFLGSGSLVRRLIIGVASVAIFTLALGKALEPPLSVTQMEDFLPLLLGVALAWVLASTARALRARLSNGTIW